MKKMLLLTLAVVTALPLLTQAQCSTTNATSCVCATAGSTNCDLLPDMIVARPPLLAQGNNGVIEYSQSGNGSNNGRLRLSVSTPNIGHGPLEVRTTNKYICGTDTIVGTAPATCPTTGLPPKQLVVQRVYHKNGNQMTYQDRDAGSMTYHPSHGHMHVDEWGEYTLRTQSADPNPLNWPIVGTGAKLAFCLMDYGTCSYYNGHCVDNLGNTLTNSNFPNFGLGGGAYNCSPVVQGISSGWTDIYYQYLDGMYITIPPGTCNGQYYIVVNLDPHDYFLEENENNNVLVVPYTLTQQAGSVPVITTSGSTSLCPGSSVTLTSSTAPSYQWSTGATTQSITVNTAGIYTVTTNVGSTCAGSSAPVTVTTQTMPVTVTPTASSLCPGQSATLNTTVTAPPTGVVQVVNTNNSVINIPDNNTTGITSSITVSGISPSTINATTVHSVQLNITHPYVGDLILELVAPNGSVVTLCEQRGSTGDNFNNTNFSMTGSTSITNGSAPFQGSYIPEDPFSMLTGNSNGIWRLRVKDVASSDIGTLNTWTLRLNNTVTTQLTYSWSSVPVGFTSSAANPTVTPSASTTYNVTVNNLTNGCSTTAGTSVTVNAIPNISISGSNSICAGSSTTLTASASGTTNWLWSPSTGLSATNIASVQANPLTTTTYTVTGTNSAGCTGSANITVTVNPVPVVTLGSFNAICNNAAAITLSGGAPSGGSYSGPGVSGTSFNPAVAGIGTHTIGYSYTNGSGCTSSASSTIVVNNCTCTTAPGTPTSIQGVAKPCPGGTYGYFVNNNIAVTTYTWTVPANTSIVSGQGTNNIVLAVNSAFVGGSLCVTGTNACGTSPLRCKSIARDYPSTPSAITGLAKACPGTSTTYSVTNIAGLTYTWVAPANTTISGGQGTSTIILDVGAGFVSGSLCVTASNSCGTSSARCKTISRNLPGTPGTVQGNFNGICQAATTISVPAVAGNTYAWTLPAGTTMGSGQGTNSITFSTNAGFVSGQICVTTNNGCMTSAARCITAYSSPAKPVVSGPLTVCVNQQGVPYSIAPVFGATTYNWVVPSGSSVASGQGTTATTVNFGATTGKVTAYASNSCGSRSGFINITFNCRVAMDDGPGFDVTVVPNPAIDRTEIIVSGDVNDKVIVTLSNILGNDVLRKTYDVQAGSRIPLDVSTLSKGIYMVSVQQGTTARHVRLVVD